ncbi:hypothetical protein M728_005775 (plasmid) [Ensifer sp. WSM1721]
MISSLPQRNLHDLNINRILVHSLGLVQSRSLFGPRSSQFRPSLHGGPGERCVHGQSLRLRGGAKTRLPLRRSVILRGITTMAGLKGRDRNRASRDDMLRTLDRCCRGRNLRPRDSTAPRRPNALGNVVETRTRSFNGRCRAKGSVLPAHSPTLDNRGKSDSHTGGNGSFPRLEENRTADPLKSVHVWVLPCPPPRAIEV